MPEPQTTSDPAPTRSRKRWLIWGTLMLAGIAVVAVWWAGRGVIDPRLVGRWENIEHSGLPGDLTFSADGNSSYVAAYISLPLYSSTRWCVQKDELVFTYPTTFDRSLSWRALQRNFDSAYAWIANGGPGMMRMRIRELTDTTLTLELGEAWGPKISSVARFRRKVGDD